MTGDILQTRNKSNAPLLEKNQLPLWVLTCAIALIVASMSGCQNLGQHQNKLPVPDPILDTSLLDNVRFQSPQGSGSRPQQGSGSRQAGTPGLLNAQSHRIELDGPIVNIDENTDRSQLVAAVHFQGNSILSTQELRRNISTRPGRFYDPDKLQQDVQQLWKLPEVARVNGPYIEHSQHGVAITIGIEERNTVANIEFIGNRGIDDRTLRKESGLGDIGHLDVHRIRIAKSKIEDLYQQRGFPRTQVEIKEGNEATDSQVVFLIHEDTQQRIWNCLLYTSDAADE